MVRASWILVLICWGGSATTDYNAPESRLLDTAYTLPANDYKIGLGLVGRGYDDLGASLEFRAGLPVGLELGTNVLHDVAGLLNLNLRWNAIDHRWVGLGVVVGVKWLNPHNIWLIPKDAREEMPRVDLLIVPIAVTMSLPLASWFGAHTKLGYNHSSLISSVQVGAADASGSVGARELYVDQSIAFYPGLGMAIVLGAQMPLYAAGVTDVVAEVEVQPGVRMGAVSQEYVPLDVLELYTFYGALEFNHGTMRTRLSLVHGLRFLTGRVPFPLPSLEMYWRF